MKTNYFVRLLFIGICIYLNKYHSINLPEYINKFEKVKSFQICKTFSNLLI